MMLYHDLSQTLTFFNSRSRDPSDHFKLVDRSAHGGPVELRLCSAHPRFVACTCDDRWVHVRGDGPGERLRLRFEHGSVEALGSLLEVLRQHRCDGGELLDWEMDDWVGAGYPCRMWERGAVVGGGGRVDDLGPDSLWCVELFPGRMVLKN